MGGTDTSAADGVAEPGGAAPPTDPGSLVRSKSYRALLVFAALLGVVVSVASWAFLELIHYLQLWVFKDLPSGLGFDTVPTWWPLPVLGIAGVSSDRRDPPARRRGPPACPGPLTSGGPTTPIELPGVLLAARLDRPRVGARPGGAADRLGSGLALLSVRLSKKDAPDQVTALMAAAASFAAISSLFGSPIIGAVIIIEAAGLGGATLPVILLPGLLAAGIGSLVFIGVGSLTGLSANAYAIAPLTLPAYKEPTFGALLWSIALAVAVAVVAFLVVQIGRRTKDLVLKRPLVLIPSRPSSSPGSPSPSQISGEPANVVLFSGQDAMGSIVNQAATMSLGALALLMLFKGLASGSRWARLAEARHSRRCSSASWEASSPPTWRGSPKPRRLPCSWGRRPCRS